MINPYCADVFQNRIPDNETFGYLAAPTVAPVAPCLEDSITHILNMLGVPAHLKGFHYARKAIAAAAENSETISAITKVIYPSVAKTYNTTPSRVERAIRHAIGLAWERCNAQTL